MWSFKCEISIISAIFSFTCYNQTCTALVQHFITLLNFYTLFLLSMHCNFFWSNCERCTCTLTLQYNLLILPPNLLGEDFFWWVGLIILGVSSAGQPLPLGWWPTVTSTGNLVTCTLYHTLWFPAVLFPDFFVAIITDTSKAAVLLGTFLLCVFLVKSFRRLPWESTEVTDTTIATTCKRSKVILLYFQRVYPNVTIARGVHALITSRSHTKNVVQWTLA